jgi:prepilin-type processing-associated H-X9-DG protein
MDNLRALLNAWGAYAHDNDERLVGASGWRYRRTLMENWSGGSWLDLDRPLDSNSWDHDSYTKKSPLWRYLNSTTVFHCPSDPSTAVNDRGEVVPRIRSYSLNNWVGGPGWKGDWIPSREQGWRVYVKTSDFIDPGPSRTFNFLDEREDSINDGHFALDMDGYPGESDRWKIVNYPTDWHNGGANLGFADLHVENWRWHDTRTMPAHSGRNLFLDVPSPGNQDVLRLQKASTRFVE